MLHCDNIDFILIYLISFYLWWCISMCSDVFRYWMYSCLFVCAEAEAECRLPTANVAHVVCHAVASCDYGSM